MKDINEAFEALNNKGLIFAGSIVPAEEIEAALGIKKEDKDFVWKKLSLRQRIELDCFFVTERGCNENAIKILNINEMADFADKKLTKNKESNEKIALILKGADCSKLSKEEKYEHDVSQKRAANCASAMGTELLRKIVL